MKQTDFDYALFKKYLICEKCGYQINGKLNFIVPTFIEVCCFLIGILFGVGLL